jgi:hypothetical protein
VNCCSRITAQSDNLSIRSNHEKGGYLETFLVARFTAVDYVDLQSLQVAGKHPPLRVGESGQVFGTGLAKDTGGESNEIAALVHGTNGGVDIEVEFPRR